MQGWLAVAVSRAFPWRHVDVTGVSNGCDLLYSLAERGPYDLVVAHAALPDLAGSQVLAMVRTAGLDTPFLLLSQLPTPRLRSLVGRLDHVALLDDPLDAAAIGATVRRMVDHTSSPVETVTAIMAGLELPLKHERA